MDTHLIPRFYLAGFVDPEPPAGYEPFLWVWDLSAKDWKKRAPKNFATKRDYYVLQDREGRSYPECEKFMADLESAAAPVIARLLDGAATLTGEDQLALARFVALMETRLPERIERFQDSLGEVGKMMMARYRQVFAADPSALERFRTEYRERTGRSDLADLTADALDPRLFELKATKELVLPAMLRAVDSPARVIASMDWDFLVTSGPNWFITSDNPCHRLDTRNLPPALSGGLVDPEIELTLPLSREVALLATWKKTGARWLDATAGEVRQINLRTVARARRFVAAPKPAFPGDSEILEAIRTFGPVSGQ